MFFRFNILISIFYRTSVIWTITSIIYRFSLCFPWSLRCLSINFEKWWTNLIHSWKLLSDFTFLILDNAFHNLLIISLFLLLGFFKDLRMVFWFHPSMRFIALHSILTSSLLNTFNVIWWKVPVWTFFRLN